MPSIDFASLVQHYGLAAVFLGAFLEGETVLLLAGASTHVGLLDLRAVMAVAAVGAFFGDNAFFLLGRHFGAHVTERFPKLAPAVPRVDALIARWRWIAVILLRFMYGVRIAGPILVGAGSMPTWEFVAANAIGAVIWAILIAGLGYAAGHAVERVLGQVVEAERVLLIAVVVIVAAVLVVHGVLRRRAARERH